MVSSVASSEELAMSDVSGVREDKIFVSIRLRPLSDNDLCNWECIDDNTLIFRNPLHERPVFPSAHTFDRVFGCDASTRKVYEEGAKEVALSVINGINSSILAYGQTSSGKTYTMCGITAYAVSDIYDFIEQQSDRDFVVKLSAMEIYNEAVTDLLSSDNAPLRLLDDPERGTVIERLTEDTIRDKNHLAELLCICEAQRKIGDTSLNETSSRSHQIIRVTVESSARDYFCTENSNTLKATVNFVDLAGSERASQTLSAGTRLKEGCHINRSLLTLGTVIRKLSKGRRVHVPYRDSRLTRILQNSLGGNARTSIICTMSPAHDHVEQSRNTLLFASCAKQVSNNAQVNVLSSDKTLVKQLKKELVRLENHVRSSESTYASSDTAELLRERKLQIEKMDKEIKEVTQQRDLAQARVEELLRLVGEDKASRQDEYSVSGESSVIKDSLNVDVDFTIGNTCTKCCGQPNARSSTDHYFQVPEITDDNFLLDLSTPKFYGPDPCRGWEFIHQRIGEKSLDICKDVQCIEVVEESRLDRTIETDVSNLPIPDRKDTKNVIEDPLNEEKMSSPRKEVEESNLTRECNFCDSPKQELMDMDEDVVASPRKEDNNVSVELFYDNVEQENQHIDADGETYPHKEDADRDIKSSPTKEGLQLNNTNTECAYMALHQKVHNMQKAVKRLLTLTILEPTSRSCGNIKLARSISCTRAIMTHSSYPLLAETDKDVIAPPSSHEMEFLLKTPKRRSQARSCVRREKFCRQDSMKTVASTCLPSEHTKMLEEDINAVDDLYRELKDRAKSQSESQHDDNLVREVTCYEDVEEEAGHEDLKEGKDGHEDVKEGEDSHEVVKEEDDTNEDVKEEEDGYAEAGNNLQPRDDWAMEFQRQRSQIIELWDACYVSLVHRSYFFLLFNGDPSDSIYMEVELRRLSFLITSFNINNPTKNSFTPTRASSMKALTREREMLSKQIHKKLERNERESLYKKWGINLNTKQRSVQMMNRIWTDTKEMVQVEESAALVAKLLQLMEPGCQVPKEMFGLSFSAGPTLDKRYNSWRSFSNLPEVQFQF